MTVGGIHWVELPPADGHEQGGRRPAIIVQDEAYAGALPVVLAVPLTTALATTRFAGTVRIPPTAGNGLRQPSVALAFQLRAVDRRRLRDQIDTVDAESLQEVFGTLDKLLGRSQVRSIVAE